MEASDIDLEFDPPGAISDAERQHWRMIVAQALKDVPGGITATFVREGDEWILQSGPALARDNAIGGLGQTRSPGLSEGHGNRLASCQYL